MVAGGWIASQSIFKHTQSISNASARKRLAFSVSLVQKVLINWTVNASANLARPLLFYAVFPIPQARSHATTVSYCTPGPYHLCQPQVVFQSAAVGRFHHQY